MKISRKLKIGVSLADPCYPALLPLGAMKTPELEERVEKTAANMCANALSEGGWEGYDMSGMLYDPIFQITFCAPCHRRAEPLLFRFSLALCSTSVILFSFLMSLSFPLSLSLSAFCSPKFGSHVHPPWFVFAYCKIVRLISRGLFDPRTEI